MTKKLRTRGTIVSCAAIIALFLVSLPAMAQVPVVLAPIARQQFFAADGAPLANGCVFTYNSGTSTPAATYTDQTGLYQASNPIILDGGGFATIWITSQSYRFVLFSTGGTNCLLGTQQWLVDGVNSGPFLAGNNAWTGANSFAGTTTFNGLVNMNDGGSMSGTFSGAPTFSGNPTFSGFPVFSNNQPFPLGISTDIIDGITAGGLMNIAGAPGENIFVQAGNATASNAGGALTLAGGTGGPSGGVGGGISIYTGAGQGANANGGDLDIATGIGSGAGNAGNVNLVGGTGGASAGTGSNVSVTAGAGGAGGAGGNLTLAAGNLGTGGTYGSHIFGGANHWMFTAPATAANPSCGSSSGLGGGTCGLLTYSTDASGTILLNPVGSPSSTGTFVLSFYKSMGTNGIFCMVEIQDDQTSGMWAPGAYARVYYNSPVSIAGTGVQIDWTNGTTPTNLTAGDTYMLNYGCRGEN
jgi:hypothetical protein